MVKTSIALNSLIALTLGLQCGWLAQPAAAEVIEAMDGSSPVSEHSSSSIPGLDDIIKGTVRHDSDQNSPADAAKSKDKLEAVIHATETSGWEREHKLGHDALTQGCYDEAQKHFLNAIRERWFLVPPYIVALRANFFMVGSKNTYEMSKSA